MTPAAFVSASDSVATVMAAVAEARRRWFLRIWLQVVTQTLIVTTLALVAAWAAWRFAPLGAESLPWLGAAVLAVTVAFAAWRAGRFRKRPTDVQVARYVEERAPSLDEALVSATESIAKAHESPIVGLLLVDAASRVNALDFDSIVSRAELRRRGVQAVMAGAALLVALVALREPVLQGLDVLRMRIAPPTLALEVVPGDIRVREGATVTFRARVSGLLPRVPREALTVRLDLPDGARELPMRPDGEWQQVALEGADRSFTYRVAGQGLTSAAFNVEVKPRPRVARIDVHYQFPSFSGLKPHVDEDGGDVYAPAGTKVRLVVHTTVPVVKADVGLGSGATLSLGSTPSHTVEGELLVSRDDTYRLTLVDDDGERTVDDTEYFVRTVDDRPPEVRILRPAGDKRVTRLEEVVIEARADDDFGVDRLELVFAARGGEEKAVRLPATGGESASGRHTLFLEELDVEPGDFVSYYARARDVGRGKQPTEVRSDIFFLEVRPFNEEFQAAQSSAMMGAGGGAFDDLAARQKELIIATWKIERRAAAGRSADDIRTLARAQSELKTKAEQLAARMVPQNIQRRPRQGQVPPVVPGPNAADQPLRKAVEAMGRSQESLEALRPNQAIPHEMEALNQLLRAEAEVTRRQVARQQSAGGGGRSGNQDLSSLFDRELQRQQQTNYENRTTTQEAQQREQQGSEALDQLRELARRQDELGRRQAELARRRDQMAAEEAKRQLERLTREQEELRRELERLTAQLGQQQQQSASSAASQSGQQSSRQGGQSGRGQASSSGGQQSGSLQQAAEAMQQSSSGLSADRLREAAQEAQRAAERLRQAEQALAGSQPDEAARQAGDLQMQAAQLAELERRLARRLRDGGEPGTDELRRMAGEQERAAERAGSLARGAQNLAGTGSTKRGSPDSSAQARQEGARALADGKLESDLRASARTLRQLADGPRATGQGQRRQEADRAEGIARSLEAAARALGRGAGESAERSRLSEQLARAGELRDRLGELTRQVRDGAPRAQGQARGQGEREATPSQGTGEGRQGQPGTAGRRASSSGQGQSGPGGQGAGGADGRPGPDEIGREIRSLQRLAEGLGEEGEGLRRALQTMEGSAPSRSAPGTESWKQDFARWESLQRELGESLEQIQARLSDRLRVDERENRLDAGASDAAPDAYRREVARYYRALARKPQP